MAWSCTIPPDLNNERRSWTLQTVVLTHSSWAVTIVQRAVQTVGVLWPRPKQPW